ncbi:helix-turn-helix domain-containing protein [Streptomyces lonarensis]|uniref:Helix-turn-helix domain-containing protein n=1 Tax=Streptomyces lonarensis TaxID=700599 RepID=A0A7X6D5L5_9ACTN|nr:helix-turn-helix transcriptional regulator [Streptomyces lonarensis]NJQ08613.1 helix-turn-helix domain-containing protein [Streptomyces lonarensis]
MVPFDVHGLGEFLRDQRRQARLSLRQLADAAGVSNPYLSQIERGLRKPSAEILQQIAKGLEISAETLYVRAGILDEEVREDQGTEGPGVIEAVNADPVLTEAQKQALVEIYHSFRRAAAPTGQATGGAGPAPDATAPRPEPRPGPSPDGTRQDHAEQPGSGQDGSDDDSPGRARSTDDQTEK